MTRPNNTETYRGPLPTVLGTAELTEDMVETLQRHFSDYEVDGVVTVEVTSHGLWLPNPRIGGRQFLGLARLPEPSHRN